MIGKFKEEANGKPITEFVGLRPNMYSFLIDYKGHTTEKHRAKGIKRGRFARDPEPAVSRSAAAPSGEIPAEQPNWKHAPQDLHN